nr:very short patch repair endonuclease [Shinella curvata]
MIGPPTHRSWIMSRIRSTDTAPEMVIRKLVHSMSYRYRLHAKDLPGKPDLVFRGRRKVIFVNGCFWHSHDDERCRLSKLPKSRIDYWQPKLARTKERDRKNEELLMARGWDILVLWECQIKRGSGLAKLLSEFLGS